VRRQREARRPFPPQLPSGVPSPSRPKRCALVQTSTSRSRANEPRRVCSRRCGAVDDDVQPCRRALEALADALVLGGGREWKRGVASRRVSGHESKRWRNVVVVLAREATVRGLTDWHLPTSRTSPTAV
jgi:hypothetical protein